MRLLEGKVALVTGGAKGIGRGIALALAAAGADVAITYSSSQQQAQATVEQLRALGVEALAVWCDVRNSESVREAVRAVADRFRSVDLLVNNAGVFESVALESISPEQWDDVFATNTRGPFLMAQAALLHLRAAASGGRIVNIGSLGGIHPWRRTGTTAHPRRHSICCRRRWPRPGHLKSA